MKMTSLKSKKVLGLLLALVFLLALPVGSFATAGDEQAPQTEQPQNWEYTVLFENVGEESETVSQTFLTGTSVQYPENAQSVEKEGYSFVGWTTEENNADTLVTALSPEIPLPGSEHTLYAYYEAQAQTMSLLQNVGATKEVTITYARTANYFTVKMDNFPEGEHTVVVGDGLDDFQIPTEFPVPTQNASTVKFEGWAFKADGSIGMYFPTSGANYITDAEIERALEVMGATESLELTLYPRWEYKGTISLNPQDQNRTFTGNPISFRSTPVSVPISGTFPNAIHYNIQYTYTIDESAPNTGGATIVNGVPVMTNVGVATVNVSAKVLNDDYYKILSSLETPVASYQIEVKPMQVQVFPSVEGDSIQYGTANEDIDATYYIAPASQYVSHTVPETVVLSSTADLEFSTDYDDANSAARNVGTYDMWWKGYSTATLTGEGAENYALVSTVLAKGDLQVTSIPVTLTANDRARLYNTDLSVPFDSSITAGALVFGESIADYVDLRYNTAATKDSDVGTYPIEVSGTAVEGKTQNYDIAYEEGTLTVLNNDSLVISSANPYTGTYDASAHDALNELDSNVPNTKFSYSVNGGPFSDTLPKFTDAGDYTVTVRAEADGYTSVENSYTVTIAKKPVTITLSNYSKTVGENDPAFEAVLRGLEGDDLLEYVLSRTEGETEGTYPITATFTDNPNYEVSVEEGTLSVLEEIAAEILPDNDAGTPEIPQAPADAVAAPVVTPAAAPVVVPAVAPVVAPVVPAALTLNLQDTILPLANAPVFDDVQVEIGDTVVPLAAHGGNWALLNLLLVIGTIFASITLMITHVAGSKNRKVENRKHSVLLKVLSIPVALLSAVLFLLTQDMSLQMVLADQWTLIMAVILLAQFVLAALSRKKAVKENEEYQHIS